MRHKTNPPARAHRLTLPVACAFLCIIAGGVRAHAQTAQDDGAVASATTQTAVLDLTVTKTPWDIDAPSATLAHAHEVEGPDKAQRREIKLQTEEQHNTECESGGAHAKPCHLQWGRLLAESLFFLASQHAGNIALDHDTRIQLTHGSFWGDYEYCVEHYRWSRWKDDDPFGVDYIGHPMMGALTSSIYEQNDPKQRALIFANTRRYWNGRLKAMAYSAVYSAQWKIGPASEASVGNTGLGYYIRQRDGVYTNETGMQDFFITPVGGLAWNVGEDIIDRYLFRPVIRNHRNKYLLLAAAMMTPMRAGANASRFRALYYRDLDVETAQHVATQHVAAHER